MTRLLSATDRRQERIKYESRDATIKRRVFILFLLYFVRDRFSL